MAISDPVNLPPVAPVQTQDGDIRYSLPAGTCLRVKTGGGTSSGYLRGIIIFLEPILSVACALGEARSPGTRGFQPSACEAGQAVPVYLSPLSSPDGHQAWNGSASLQVMSGWWRKCMCV